MAFSRTILAAGSLLVSASLAEARGDKVADFPIAPPMPAERPLLLDGFSAAALNKGNGTIEAKRARRGRRSRLAEVTGGRETLRGSMTPGTEAASATPETAVAGRDGPHEAAAPTLSDLVARHAIENGVPVSLAQAVVRIESRGNPHASNGGALGLMQIKPGTARAAGFSGGASGLFVANTNLHFGMKILGDAFRSSGGDVCRALMLYQSGHLATHMTRSNRIYCAKARSVMAGA